MDGTSDKRESAITLTADVISAYVSNNHVQTGELVRLIREVHSALVGIAEGVRPAEPPQKATAAEIRRSINHDFLISFEDGKPYKTLRRHLTMRGLTPESYRRKWGLPPDYPMTSASYSEQRSQLARTLGLGQQRRRRGQAEAAGGT
ncbi:transcriptional regulator, MucR family [Methylobacterium sp. 4-46]|uniref:MucR family transcriptional regulator n=1 Tax=unclassified Methylobacterium TaxID=2615210 RepID=UPI000152D0B2|nr:MULTISPECIES: MucR family transcriptional regulator [Methylobacterium]ACA15560.1 transcriptional regulator, MucR family [Methylobacterium sp. 4-46]WFT81273.1 MucR family transcriptional regulator [Methylobacterium nodulans]